MSSLTQVSEQATTVRFNPLLSSNLRPSPISAQLIPLGNFSPLLVLGLIPFRCVCLRPVLVGSSLIRRGRATVTKD